MKAKNTSTPAKVCTHKGGAMSKMPMKMGKGMK